MQDATNTPMNEIPVTLTALTISRELVLAHLHRLATGFAASRVMQDYQKPYNSVDRHGYANSNKHKTL